VIPHRKGAVRMNAGNLTSARRQPEEAYKVPSPTSEDRPGDAVASKDFAIALTLCETIDLIHITERFVVHCVDALRLEFDHSKLPREAGLARPLGEFLLVFYRKAQSGELGQV
jgi:hypothetical protein